MNDASKQSRSSWQIKAQWHLVTFHWRLYQQGDYMEYCFIEDNIANIHKKTYLSQNLRIIRLDLVYAYLALSSTWSVGKSESSVGWRVYYFSIVVISVSNKCSWLSR